MNHDSRVDQPLKEMVGLRKRMVGSMRLECQVQFEYTLNQNLHQFSSQSTLMSIFPFN